MYKPITKCLVDASSVQPITGRAVIIRCSECRKKFEKLSDQWAYRFMKKGKLVYQCSWTCHRLAEARLFPRKTLRGEYLAETMAKRCCL